MTHGLTVRVRCSCCKRLYQTHDMGWPEAMRRDGWRPESERLNRWRCGKCTTNNDFYSGDLVTTTRRG